MARAAKCKGSSQNFYAECPQNFWNKTLKLTKDKAFFQAGTKDKRGVTAQFITTYIDADRVLKVTSEHFYIRDFFGGKIPTSTTVFEKTNNVTNDVTGLKGK